MKTQVEFFFGCFYLIGKLPYSTLCMKTFVTHKKNRCIFCSEQFLDNFHTQHFSKSIRMTNMTKRQRKKSKILIN